MSAAQQSTEGATNNRVTDTSSRLAVTFFTSVGASSKTQGFWSLDVLGRHIAATTGPRKEKLPWLKLATFGDKRTSEHSLRHDENVVAVTGVEADYDAEAMSFDDAVERVTKQGILCIVYTSPSHTEDHQRWRVLCPFSRPKTPEFRNKMLGRLNGLYHGIFSGESWALSQSYYYGSVASNPSHRVEVIDGTPIDLHDDLDASWQGKPQTTSSNRKTADGFPQSGPVDEAELLEQILRSESFHQPMVRLIGLWAFRGVSMLEARQRLTTAMEAVAALDRDARWQARFDDIERCLLDIYGKEAGKRDKEANNDKPGSNGGCSLPTPIDSVLAEFNERYFVVNEAGKAVILAPSYDPVLKRRQFDRMTPRDLQTLYLNQRIQVSTGDKEKPIYKTKADVWLHHPDRHQYIHGVVFDPTSRQARPGVLNLWEGFAIKAAKGDWSLLRTHIEAIVCDDDPIRFSYLMGWMARMLQRPAELGEVAIVLKGGEGTGKGTLAKALKRIVGHHSLAISNAKHLIGNFNSHLRDTIFLFADEAFFAGDRAHVGVLKSLITEPNLTIEAKYANAIEVPNYLHILMASNEDWVVPASLDARRFLVLEVSESRKGDHGYFAAIWNQMESGGYEAMLHELLARDLSTFNVRDVPTTGGLQEQRKLSLGTTESWWLDCLERGYVYRSKLGLEKDLAVWHAKLSTELLFESYLEFAKARNERRRLTRETLGRFLITLNAEPARWRLGVVGEHVADVPNAFGGTTRKAELVRQERVHGCFVGSLSRARADFSAATGLSITWDSGTDEDDNV